MESLKVFSLARFELFFFFLQFSLYNLQYWMVERNDNEIFLKSLEREFLYVFLLCKFTLFHDHIFSFRSTHHERNSLFCLESFRIFPLDDKIYAFQAFTASDNTLFLHQGELLLST